MSNAIYYYYDKNDQTKGDWFNINNWWISPDHNINTQSLPDESSIVYVLPGSIINKASTLAKVDQIKIDNAILDIDIYCNDIFFINNAMFKDINNDTIIGGIPKIPVIYSKNSVFFINGSKNYGCIHAANKVGFYDDIESALISINNTVGAYETECLGQTLTHSPLGRPDALMGNPPQPVPEQLTAQKNDTRSYSSFVSGGKLAGSIIGPASIIFNDASYNAGLITYYNNKMGDFLEQAKLSFGKNGPAVILSLYKKIASLGLPVKNGKPHITFNGYSSNESLIASVSKCQFSLGSFNSGVILNGDGQQNLFLDGQSAVFSSFGCNKGKIVGISNGSSTTFINSINTEGSVVESMTINFISSSNNGSLGANTVNIKSSVLPDNSAVGGGVINLMSTINNGSLTAKSINCNGSVIGPNSDINCDCGPGISLDANSSMDITLFQNPYWYYVPGGTMYFGSYVNGIVPSNGSGRIELVSTRINTSYPSPDRIVIEACCPDGYVQDLRPTSATFGKCILLCLLLGQCDGE